MAVEEAILETTEYRLALVQPDSRKLLVLDGNQGWCLPQVRIPQQTRPAEQLRKSSKAAWGLDILILDFFPSEDAYPRGAIAEILNSNPSDDLRSVDSDSIGIDQLSEQQRAHLANECGAHLGGANALLNLLEENGVARWWLKLFRHLSPRIWHLRSCSEGL
jgi:hypothetical protein